MTAFAPLYLPRLEHDACGVALLADVRRRSSHELVERGLHALARLAHRGGGAGPVTLPDGAGVLTAIPWKLLASDVAVPRRGRRARAAGMFFFPAGAAAALQAEVARALAAHGWKAVAWRAVPVNRDALHPALVAGAPDIWQVTAIDEGPPSEAGRRLYRARLQMQRALSKAGAEGADVVSLSTRTIVYKGLLRPVDLPRFYLDLREAAFESPLMIVHERYSTNTFPRWELAQPFRVLAHNGEINTIAGNRRWMAARERDAGALPGLQDAGPLVRPSGSDSQSLDDAVEVLRFGGASLPQALARLIPPTWEADPRFSADERAFYQYQACLAEPWDGPAAIAFSDGRMIGAAMDRNGLRPARFIRTADDQFFLGSEAGIFGIPDDRIVQRGRLGPGEIVAIDLEACRIDEPAFVRRSLAAGRPYAEIVARSLVHLRGAPSNREPRASVVPLERRQKLFGFSSEEISVILRPMAEQGHEPVGSMGDDTPLAALSERPRLFTDYFRQRFAQVTNPAIDPLRERSVMSLQVILGARTNLFENDAADCRWLALSSPVLSSSQFAGLVATPGFAVATVPSLFDPTEGERGLRDRLHAMVHEAVNAVDAGATLLVLSDRDASDTLAPVPALLATAAVHQGLIDAGRRMRASLIVDTGEARDAHQVAALLAFGASAVFPSVACETVAAVAAKRGSETSAAIDRYRQALEEGLLKIFSKMGISTASGYTGAQLFDVLGLDRELCARWFSGVPCQIGGAGLDEIARQVLRRHQGAFEPGDVRLEHPGLHGYRRDGEYHAYNPIVIRELHQAVQTRSPDAYDRFARLVDERPPTSLRDLIEFRDRSPIPLDEVEPADAICRRFFAAAMSVGALSPEAHRTIAMAMNMLGARSNSGEGGEERDRWRTAGETVSANSATKQVASARFGVTAEYLVSASELQIKIAQGSKPGEGGQLPASKAVEHIARLRHAQPGITLISPPPHHDIYSIEDLAQLIHDLREVQPHARINVKLVAQAGVGIVAAGVAKAGAAAVLISGHDGGTGASPRGSIKHAGGPWELGLAETHQVLTLNGLRGRVVLQTDGGLKTGRDVAIAAALGADEFGFGTAALVAIGCVMARQCHLNTCPVGIATQRDELRQRFAGTPEMAVAYFRMLASDVRQVLAALGLRALQDLVGRADLLRPKVLSAAPLIDLTPLLVRAEPPQARVTDSPGSASAGTPTLNARTVEDAGPALGVRPVRLGYGVANTDRAVGARLAGVIARRFGDAGVPRQPVTIALAGSAGQSLGAFILPGMHLHLAGEANDYLGKGMHGGQIVVRPPQHAPAGAATSQVLVGNTALYGATGGRVFIAGRAGERFAVRNSGATAVVEGVGDHGCEYMTGGEVVVLGPTGSNFAAGMSGGVVYVYDPDARFPSLCNREMVEIASPPPDELPHLHGLIATHAELTGSACAAALLQHWLHASRCFRKVMPGGVIAAVAETLDDRDPLAASA